MAERTTLPCPWCGNPQSACTHAYLIETEDRSFRRRRRVCRRCGLSFFTRETLETDTPSEGEGEPLPTGNEE